MVVRMLLIVVIIIVIIIIVIIIILAQDQEAYGVYYNRDHMDLGSSVYDTSEFFDHSHHWKYLHTVVRLQQLCCAETSIFGIFHYIPVANAGDGVLLLKNCLQTMEQGNYRVIVQKLDWLQHRPAEQNKISGFVSRCRSLVCIYFSPPRAI